MSEENPKDLELFHYGVKGMKWGVRRSEKALAKARSDLAREKSEWAEEKSLFRERQNAALAKGKGKKVQKLKESEKRNDESRKASIAKAEKRVSKIKSDIRDLELNDKYIAEVNAKRDKQIDRARAHVRRLDERGPFENYRRNNEQYKKDVERYGSMKAADLWKQKTIRDKAARELAAQAKSGQETREKITMEIGNAFVEALRKSR